MKRNHLFDVYRVIAALLIVYLHCSVPGVIGEIIGIYTILGVLFFFAITGYFLADSEKTDGKQIRKLGLMFLGTSLFYLVWNIAKEIYYSYRYNVENIVRIIKQYLGYIFSKESLKKLIIYNETHIAGHTWFIMAMLYSILLFFLLKKMIRDRKKRYCIFLIIAIVLNTGCAVLGAYAPIFIGHNVACTKVRNYFFMGLPMLLFGYCIGQKKSAIKENITPYHSVLFLCLGLVIMLLEHFTLKHFQLLGILGYYLGAYLVIYASFCLAILKQDTFKENRISGIGRKYSMWIYLIHVWVLEFLTMIWPENHNMKKLFSFIGFIVVFGCSLLIAVGIEKAIRCLKTKKE